MGELTPTSTWFIGIVVTLAVTAIAGLAKVITAAIALQVAERQSRFDQRLEVGRLILEAEQRITTRIDRLEEQVIRNALLHRNRHRGSENDDARL